MNKLLRISYLSFILLLSFARVSLSQTAFQTENELIKQGEIFFKEEKFVDAYPFYSQLVIRAPDNPDYNYHLGVCTIFSIANKELAIPFLQKALSVADNEKEVYYYLGRAFLLSYRFEDAAIQFKKYKESASPKNIEKYKIDQQIEMCANGIRLIRNIDDWMVVEKKEMSYKDFYGAYDLATIGGKLLIKPNEDKFKSPVDQRKKDDSRIFLTKDNQHIFFSSYGNDETHGKDIYRITKLPNGSWSKAQLLPPTVNTGADEDYPFFHPNGKVLYFSSKGHNSIGGYDLFKCNYDAETNTWGKPKNLGFPINSPDDDILYMTDSLEKEAYFSSARSAPQNKMSVYKLSMEKAPYEWVIVKGIIMPNRDNQNSKVTIKVKNNQDNSKIGTYHTNRNSGKYFMALPNGASYEFTVECDGFKTQSQIINIPFRFEKTPVKQEMSYDLKTDKLILKTITDNFNEEEYDQLIPSVIRNYASSAATTDNMLGTETTKNNGASDSGAFNNNAIVRLAFEDAKELDEEAMELRKQADVSLELVNQKNDLALKRSKESQTMYQAALQFTGKEEQKKALLDTANSAIKEAEQLKQEAALAYKLSKKMDVAAVNKKKEADLTLLYAKALENSAKTDHSPESMAQVAEIEKQLDDINKNNTDTLSIFDSYKLGLENKQKEINKVQGKITNIKREITDTETLITQSQTEAESTRNKSFKEALLNEVEGLKQDNIDRQEEIKKQELKVNKLQDEYNSIAKESAMAGDVVSIAKKEEHITKPNLAVINKPTPVVPVTKAVAVTTHSITPAVTPATVTLNKVPEEINYDQLLLEINELNAERVDAATENKNELERETGKAKAFNVWANDLNKLAEEQKQNLLKETDAKNKTQISNLIVKATQLAKEKKTLAAQAQAKADSLKLPPPALVINSAKTTTVAAIAVNTVTPPVASTVTTATIPAVAKATVTVPETKIDYDKLLNELNERNSEKIKQAEKIATEMERESAKAGAFYKWADDLNKYAVEEKSKNATAKNSLIENNIAKATLLAKEKRAMGDKSTSRVNELKQLAIVKIQPKPIEQPIVANNKTELAEAEKISNLVERERTKEAIYKKIAADADEEITRLRFKYNKENDREKGIEIARKIKVQEAISRENKELAKKSLVSAEYYLKNNKQTTGELEEVSFEKPLPKTEKPAETVIVQKTTSDSLSKQKEQLPLYEIYNRYTRVPSKAELSKNEKFEIGTEPTWPIPTTGVSKTGLIYTVQVGAFINPIAKGTFGGITPITSEITGSGYLRYFAGQLRQFESASKVKTQIRDIGFKDAFVVAYFNGKRITLTEALKIENGTEPSGLIANDQNATPATIKNTTDSNINKVKNNATPANNDKNAETTTTNSTKKNVDVTTNSVKANKNVTTTLATPTTIVINADQADINKNTNTQTPTATGVTTNGNTATNNKTTLTANEPKQVPDKSSQSAAAREQATASTTTATQNFSGVNGLVYTVQIGVFSNAIPPGKFGDITSITSETTEAGYIRYFAGRCDQFSAADKVKTEVRNTGFKDAFIVAYYNGKRIALIEAEKIETGKTSTLSMTTTPGLIPAVNNNAVNNAKITDLTSKMNTTTAPTNAVPVTKSTLITSETTKQTPNTPSPQITSNQQKLPAIANTENVSGVNGLFYTVQVGLFSQAMPSETFYYINPLFNETTENGKVRYSVGAYNNLTKANEAKETAVKAGISNAFVTAFYNSKRISLMEAKQLEANGAIVFTNSPVLNVLPYFGAAKQPEPIKTSNTTVTQKSTPSAPVTANTENKTIPITNQNKSTPQPESSVTATTSTDDVVFKVQIGAYKGEVPADQVNIYLKITSKGITHYVNDNGLTIYTAGNYKTYEEAEKLKTELSQQYGVKDGFVIAFKNGKKIALSELKIK